GAWRAKEVEQVLDVLVRDQVAALAGGIRAGRTVCQVHLYARPVQRGQADVGAQVGHLVLQTLSRLRLACGLGLERIDLAAQGLDLGAIGLVRTLEVLDAADERLVAPDLVGRGQQLRFDLAGQKETDRQRDQRDERRAKRLSAPHPGSILGVDLEHRGVPGVLWVGTYGGRNEGVGLRDRPAAF